MKTLCLSLILVFLIAGFGIADDEACPDELGCIEIGLEEKIVIGGLLQVAESGSGSGPSAQSAFQLAVLARKGLLLGRGIEFALEDSACSEQEAREAARRLVANQSIIGIIGTNCSLAAKGALPIISEAGWLMISPSNTSPFLTNVDREAGGLYQPGYFRTAHNDLFQGALSAQFARAVLNVDSVATIDDGDPYTSGLAGAMADTFSSLNGEVVFRGVIRKGATDISELISAIVQSEAQLVYFPVFTAEAIVIVQQLTTTAGLEDTIMMTADGAFSTSFVQGAGEAAMDLYVAGPHVIGEAYEAFLETWKREIDEAGPTGGFHAQAYDAANLLLDALESVARERDDGTLTIGRGALREALSAVEDYPGLTGSLTCQDASPYAGDCATGEALAIFQLGAAEVHDGNWPPPAVWTAAMAD